jgi:DNA replication and repair protein RecF
MHALAIEALSIRALRNLAQVDVEPGPRFNVLSGDNGQGKTNVLEAIYAVATSRSFRANKMSELIAHGASVASVRARILEGAAEQREQTVGLQSGVRSAKIDGKRPATLAAYAVRTPVVVFHPAGLALSTAGGTERRRLLDRLALYITPDSLSSGESYGRALRERQRALAERGPSAVDLVDWEELIVRHGLDVSAAREDAATRLGSAAEEVFGGIGSPEVVFSAKYARSAPTDAASYRAELVRRRTQDLRRGAASLGPHRDDLELKIDSHLARVVASQGQHRAIVLALKLAEILVIGQARGVQPILLLDDVSSELDRERSSSLFRYLRERQGQVFLTTTRRDLIDTGEGASDWRRDFTVEFGRVRGGK